MNAKNLKWIVAISLALTLAGWTALAQPATNIFPRPAAMQPGGDPTDTTLNFGQWWTGNGTVSESFDTTTQSSNNISGSIYVIVDCPGAAGVPAGSANLAFGNFVLGNGDNGWLGNWPSIDASRYQSLSMDIKINTAVSSNTPVPITLYGHNYENVGLTNLPATNSAWQHVVIPISPTISLGDCTAYGSYFWYNTTASTPEGHVEYWFDNVELLARPAPPPPPTLTAAPVTRQGLILDCAPGEGGQRGAFDEAVSVQWQSLASAITPVTYSMKISWVPSPNVYSNYEADIALAPDYQGAAPYWNPSDAAYLQILDNADGTATARMMWKTNDPLDDTMLFNTQPGGPNGTNGYAAGTMGYLTATSMIGNWSITFYSDTNFTVAGPGVSTNFTLPGDWLTSFENATAAGNGTVYAMFCGGPNGAANSGQPMYFSQVVISGPPYYMYTNNFTTLPLDTTTWRMDGNEMAIVPADPCWWVSWTMPATGFGLWTAPNLNRGTAWTLLSGNTNLLEPVNSYLSGTNTKAIVPVVDLGAVTQNFFQLRSLAATSLQVLMPGETNAPFTPTGKIGTPLPESLSANNPVPVTVNAVDVHYNIVAACADTVAITCTDTNADLPPSAALVNGTGTYYVSFSTTGSFTVTATDTTNAGVTANTGSSTTITP